MPGALKVLVGGTWVTLGGGANEVFIGPTDPGVTAGYELWFDTDDPPDDGLGTLTPHHATHEKGGTDPVAIFGNIVADSLGATPLNATQLTSGTMPMARFATSGNATDYLKGDGSWADFRAAVLTVLLTAPPPLRTVTAASAATPQPNADTTDLYTLTAQAATVSWQNPSGTPRDGHALTLRLRDDGTARTIAWGTAYMSAQVAALPLTTVASKQLHIGFRWSPAYAKWQMIALTQEP